MEGVVRGCCAGEKQPSMYYMLQKWIDFGAGWKRRPGNDKIPPEVSESTYFVRAPTISRSLSLVRLTSSFSTYKTSCGKNSDFRRLAGPGIS